MLYAAVFCARYLDLLWSHPFEAQIHVFLSLWNFFLKLFYISSSIYIVFVMLRVFARTREREKAWKFGAACLAGSLFLAPFTMMAFSQKVYWGTVEVGMCPCSGEYMLMTILVSLEFFGNTGVCLRITAAVAAETNHVPTVLDSFYLLTLGSYRAFYILNWIVRKAVDHECKLSSILFKSSLVMDIYCLPS